MNRTRELGRLLAVVTAAAIALAVLVRAGSVLPAPPRRLGELESWVVSTGTARAVFALLRLAGVGLAGYVALVFAVAAAGAALRIPTLLTVSDRLSLGAVTRLASVSTAVLAMSASALAAPAGARAAGGTGDEPVVMRLVPEPAAADRTDGSQAPRSAVPVMRLVDRSAAAATALPEAILPGATLADVEAASPRPDPGRAGPQTLRVEPGDHLWAIAERIVATAQHEPTERAVRDYWLRLVDANRDRLVDAANPDLLFAGQELVLPPSPSRGAPAAERDRAG